MRRIQQVIAKFSFIQISQMFSLSLRNKLLHANVLLKKITKKKNKNMHIMIFYEIHLNNFIRTTA
jgi:hypothetical protein